MLLQDTGLYEELSGLPEVSCPYQAPDQCNCFEPQPCCERLAAGDNAVEPTGCPATTVTVGAGRATPLSSPYFIVGCSAFLSVIIAAASF